MPAQWLGNSVSKAARAASGGGFESAIEVASLSGGNAALGWSLTGESDGDTLTITTDGTKAFGTKPVATKPRFIWRADDGQAPNSTLGVASTWGDGSSTFQNGSLSTEQVGAGQTQSCKLDHGVNSGGILNQVTVGPQRRKLVHRRRYEDFTSYSATAIRTRITSPLISGSIPSPGDTVTGGTSGATGVIQSVEDDTVNGRWAFYYEPTGGTINAQPSPTDFVWNETMTWPGGSGTNTEGSAEFPTGTYRTFNHKTLRFWPLNKTPSFINVYCGDGVPGYNPNKPQLTSEGGSSNIGGITNSTYSQLDYAYEWNTELFLFEDSSAVDVEDATMFWQKNDAVICDGLVTFRAKTTEYPSDKETIFQTQVSNGAQPGSNSYYDYLYVDDSWYFVSIRDANTGRFALLPVKAWADQQIDLHYLPYVNWTHIDIYKDGVLEGSVSR